MSDVVLVGHSYGGMVITGVADALPVGHNVLAAAPDEWLRILLDGEAVNALPGGSR